MKEIKCFPKKGAKREKKSAQYFFFNQEKKYLHYDLHVCVGKTLNVKMKKKEINAQRNYKKNVASFARNNW